jgi:flagellar biosynthesis/type III secretory pathway protein FliH
MDMDIADVDDDMLPYLEDKAQQDANRNIGFLEAYDESKELKLQEGFEAGYSSVFEDGVKLGEYLAEASLGGNLDAVKRIRLFLEEWEKMKNRQDALKKLIRDLNKEKDTPL